MLRSSWQTVNIGDIGHTPGLLALIEQHISEAEVTLWPMDVRKDVETMLQRRFLRLRIVTTKGDGVCGGGFSSPRLGSVSHRASRRRRVETRNRQTLQRLRHHHGCGRRDIGLGDWPFDLDKPEELARIVPTALALAKDPAAAKAKVARAREFVRERQRATIAIQRNAATVRPRN